MSKTTKDVNLSQKEKVEKKSTLSKKASVSAKSKDKITKNNSNSLKKSVKKADSKKVTNKKNSHTTRKKTSNTAVKKTSKKAQFSSEYYDLPYSYNQTTLKILAQTPKHLFVYWDISDYDKNQLFKQYGSHVFETTKPVLIIHNETLNYTFEVEINDFANSWYVPLKDSNCIYSVELGRRPIPTYFLSEDNKIEANNLHTSYIFLTFSNKMQMPNNRILFNTNNIVYFKNVKTNEIITKSISELLVTNIGNFSNIFDLYKIFYQDEKLLTKEFDLSNPSSHNPTSGVFSSKFK